MNSLQYRQLRPQQLEQRQFTNQKYEAVTHNTPLTQQGQKITFGYQQNMPHSIAPSPIKVYNYPHEYKPENNNLQLFAQQPPVQIKLKQVNESNISKPVVGSQTTVQRKFTPLSYEKISVKEEVNRGSTIDEKEYTQQTIKTVLIGFIILILIVGVFYGLILWDKSKQQEKQSVAANILVNYSPFTTSSASTSVTVQKEWKTLPQNQQSPLQVLQDLTYIGGRASHNVQQQLAAIKDHNSHIHLRTWNN